MRRLLLLLAAMPVLACGAALSGNYDLVTISDQELPATIEFFGTETIWSGLLTLSDSTYALTVTVSEGDGDPETENDSGAFTLDESNVIHFTPGPQSEDGEPFEGTWDGDQITVSLDDDITFVFRRRPPPSRPSGY